MLIELTCLELRQAAYAFWFFADGLVLLVLSKDCLCIFAGMFLDESFESHLLLPMTFCEVIKGIFFVSSIHLLPFWVLYL